MLCLLPFLLFPSTAARLVLSVIFRVFSASMLKSCCRGREYRSSRPLFMSQLAPAFRPTLAVSKVSQSLVLEAFKISGPSSYVSIAFERNSSYFLQKESHFHVRCYICIYLNARQHEGKYKFKNENLATSASNGESEEEKSGPALNPPTRLLSPCLRKSL